MDTSYPLAFLSEDLAADPFPVSKLDCFVMSLVGSDPFKKDDKLLTIYFLDASISMLQES